MVCFHISFIQQIYRTINENTVGWIPQHTNLQSKHVSHEIWLIKETHTQEQNQMHIDTINLKIIHITYVYSDFGMTGTALPNPPTNKPDPR